MPTPFDPHPLISDMKALKKGCGDVRLFSYFERTVSDHFLCTLGPSYI